MPKHLYAEAETRFSGHVSRGRVSTGAGSSRRANKTTRTAGVPLRTSKTGCRANGDCRCKIETACGDFAADCENKIACPAVRSYSRA
jgi:hypothetical protein